METQFDPTILARGSRTLTTFPYENREKTAENQGAIFDLYGKRPNRNIYFHGLAIGPGHENKSVTFLRVPKDTLKRSQNAVRPPRPAAWPEQVCTLRPDTLLLLQ